MCLITEQKWPKIAWKPITVYKVVYKWFDQYKTLFAKADIDIRETYRESICSILRHRRCLGKEGNKKIYSFSVGLHSSPDKEASKDLAIYYSKLYPVRVIKCTIPRFSFYWVGDGTIVSNKLKYENILHIL